LLICDLDPFLASFYWTKLHSVSRATTKTVVLDRGDDERLRRWDSRVAEQPASSDTWMPARILARD
jgi:hypothetical protein